jgi:hypothetical protein
LAAYYVALLSSTRLNRTQLDLPAVHMRLRQEYVLFALVKPADDRAATAYVIEILNCNRVENSACLRFSKDRKLLEQLEENIKTFFVFLTIGEGKGELVINALRNSVTCAYKINSSGWVERRDSYSTNAASTFTSIKAA